MSDSSRRSDPWSFPPFFLLVVLIALAAGCRSTPAAVAPAVSADAMAVVDGREITRADLDKAYNRVRDASQTLSDEETMTAKLNLLNEIIMQEILKVKADSLKIDVSE